MQKFDFHNTANIMLKKTSMESLIKAENSLFAGRKTISILRKIF
jgi:hypothetical protein